MSVKAVGWAWDLKLSLNEKAVLMAIADHCDNRGVCLSGHAQVSEKSGLSERSVIRTINRLKQQGLITSYERWLEGHKATNVLVLNLAFQDAKIDELVVFKHDTVSPLKGDTLSPMKPDDNIRAFNYLKPNTSRVLNSADFDDLDLKLAKTFFGLILALNAKHRTPNFRQWADDIRLMRERDNRTLTEIDALFRWANNDSFWRTNILSPRTLRKQWDRLVIVRDSKAKIISDTRPDSQCARRANGARCSKPGVRAFTPHPNAPKYCFECFELETLERGAGHGAA